MKATAANDNGAVRKCDVRRWVAIMAEPMPANYQPKADMIHRQAMAMNNLAHWGLDRNGQPR